MQRLEVSGAVRHIYASLGFKGLKGRDSSVGIATRYGLGGPRIVSRWGGEIFRTHPDWVWGPPRLLYNGYRVFTGGKVDGEWL